MRRIQKLNVMNTLANAHSPYLLQHAQQPVHWKIWEEQTLKDAQEKDQLLLISIGYAACHWCHVMAHECFDDHEVATLTNAHFTAIKIDREEQPEVDALYMKALQLMTGHGGWPLNIVALPDGRPIWGGTYVPKAQWIEILHQLQHLYTTDREQVLGYAQKLNRNVQLISSHMGEKPATPMAVAELIAQWQSHFDLEYGGYDHAPKFMMPVNLDYLQAYGHLNHQPALLDHVDLTLTRMAWGGLFDTVGGGFSRYAVDHTWHIPHFEKMLYDNALLLKTYTDAYKRTQNPLYKEIIQKTIAFIESELKAPHGGYYCAIDADSLNEENQQEEGAYYVWKSEELQELIGEDWPIFADVFSCHPELQWENNTFVLMQTQPLSLLAQQHQLTEKDLVEKKKKWEQELLRYRKTRKAPHTDTKILTSWNALLLTGYLHANSVLQDPTLSQAIQELTNFITEKLTTHDGQLGHAYKEALYIEGLLEDYAMTLQALITLYNYTQNEAPLLLAKNYTQWAFDLFYEPKNQLFRAHRPSALLIADQFETEDNVIPSANSIMCQNLLFLGRHFSHSYFLKTGSSLLEQVVPNIRFASTHANWLATQLLYFDAYKQVHITGNTAEQTYKELSQKYYPSLFFSFEKTAQNLSFTVCNATTCLAAVSDFNEIF